ncbi:MAG: outer membrane beta-barrel protein [Flavobacteriales bacterium]
MIQRRILSILLCCFSYHVVLPQTENGKTQLLTAGFQIRPLFASKFFGAGEVTESDRHLETTIKPRLGYTFGMIIRRGFSPKFSLEMGINYFKRNFTMINVDDSLAITDESGFGIVSYEIPIQTLFYIRLSKKMYMNVSMGTSFNWFASDVRSLGENQAFSQYTEISKGWLKFALLGNIGWEWRTEKAGFFYLGASLHRPLFPIGTSYVKYDQGPWKYDLEIPLTGGVLTIDFRYFFHEMPHKKTKKTTKPAN